MGPRDRRSLAIAALVFLAALGAGALVIDHLDDLELGERRRAAKELARGSAFAIEQRFDFALAAAASLGSLVSAGANDAQLEAVARRQIDLAGGRVSLQLARDGIISHIWPLVGNEAAYQLNLLASPIHGPFVRRVIDSGEALLYGPFTLVQGGTGFALRFPVFTGEGERRRPWGVASAIIRVEDLLAESRVPYLVTAGFEYALWRDDVPGAPRDLLASSSQAAGLTDLVTVPVELPGQRWTFGVAPARGWAENESPALVAAALLIAILAALLAYRIQALPALLRREVEARTRELEVAHAEQRRAEDAQRQSQKLESIGLLAGGVAHDFNNLLVGILGYADLLSAEAQPGTLAHDAATTIAQAARRAAELTRQLLALARLGQHREERVDLHAVVAEGAKLLGRTLDKSIRLETRLAAPRSAVMGDPGQLQQVLLNLAVNARDAMPEGGTLTLETGLVEVDAAHPVPGLVPGSYVTLAVSDTGVGISPEHLARLFEPFFTTKPVGKGSGLGLATAFGIAKGHRGTVRVESRVGEGSRFIVYLPASAAPSASGEAPAREETPPRGSGLVLVVDDEELVRRTAVTVLASLGYEAVGVGSGREALDWLSARGGPPDGVLLDLAMPEMDGRACFRAMRLRHPALRVVVCSGFSQTGGAQELLAEGAVAFVQKPYRTAELARAMVAGLGPGVARA